MLLFMYRSESVVALPKGMLSPLEGLFKWPGVYEGGISLTVWIIITKSAAAACNISE